MRVIWFWFCEPFRTCLVCKLQFVEYLKVILSKVFFTDFYRFYRVFKVCTEFNRFLKIFIKFDSVLKVFIEFCRVFKDYTKFYRILSNVTEFYRVFKVFTDLFLVLSSFEGFYRVLPSFTEREDTTAAPSLKFFPTVSSRMRSDCFFFRVVSRSAPIKSTTTTKTTTTTATAAAATKDQTPSTPLVRDKRETPSGTNGRRLP